MKYIGYCRKSTDEKDKQVLSIDQQLSELKEFAQKENLELVDVLTEAQTAKIPGRPIFNSLVKRIEKGEAHGILAWHPDRLARNSIDGGKIIYLVDTNKILDLKFPTFWFDTTPQGKFMLNIAFGQSKYYIDNLSENVKRGQRQKIRRGEMVGVAPLGYLNDLKTHTMVIDPERAHLIKKLFETYAAGNYTLKDTKLYAEKINLKSRNQKVLSVSNIQRILSKPFYYGLAQFNGEFFEGTHKPIITKKLFDEVQEVMRQRGRSKNIKKHGYIFTGFMKCGTCNCMITAEKQKGYVYYRCTKKKTLCDEKYVREEALSNQIRNFIQQVSLPEKWGTKITNALDKEREKNLVSFQNSLQNLKEERGVVEKKLSRLLDVHLEGLIHKEEYIDKKEILLNQKTSLLEKIRDFEENSNDRLERAKEFILSSCQDKKVALQGDLGEIKTFLKNIGSNFTVRGQKFNFEAVGIWKILYENLPNSSWR